ncbi:MAG: hypothetical protein JO100_07620 [Pseudonocardia sp.]|nr:hypothetical protein [Pseudonocardia sp.]
MINLFRRIARLATTTVKNCPAEPHGSAEQAGELIIHRPLTLSPGAGRRVQLYLDARRAAKLSLGDSVRIPAYAGRHMLVARCRPLISGHLPVDLAPFHTMRFEVVVNTFNELEIRSSKVVT